MEHHPLWTKKTFACVAVSIALTSGVALSVHDAKGGIHLSLPTPRALGDHTEPITSLGGSSHGRTPT